MCRNSATARVGGEHVDARVAQRLAVRVVDVERIDRHARRERGARGTDTPAIEQQRGLVAAVGDGRVVTHDG